MKIRAAQEAEGGEFHITDVYLEDAWDNEVLVNVSAAHLPQ
jgi:hypothetical protein